MGSFLVGFRFSFEYTFDIALLVILFSKTRTSLKYIARYDFDSFGVLLLFVVVLYSV